MTGKDLAYVALVVSDVEAAAAMWQRDFGLPRTDCRIGDTGRSAPVLRLGGTALALFAPGDPFVEGEQRTGVHHIALAVEDPEGAAQTAAAAGIAIAEPAPVTGLEGSPRWCLSTDATRGIRTCLTRPLEPRGASGGWARQVDHLGVASRDNAGAIDVFSRRLGCELEGTETDIESQIAVESFISDRYGTIVHSRPAELVAAVQVAFIRVGDWEFELIQEVDTGLGARAGGDTPGNTQKDHGAIARFIALRGPGLHHLALRVESIGDALRGLQQAGHVVIDRVGRPGARRSLIAFLHPKSTYGVLVHLVQRPDL